MIVIRSRTAGLAPTGVDPKLTPRCGNNALVGETRGLLWVDALLSMPTMTLPDAAKNACTDAKLHVEVHEQPKDFDEEVPAGKRVTVVLCHGFGGSARNFRPQARALASSVRIVLFDMRGHARSATPSPPQAYQMTCLVEDLASVVEAHSTGKVIVGGLSLGAAVALEYALRRPHQLAGLLLAAYPAVTTELRHWALAFAESIDKNGLEVAGERYVWGASSRFDPKARELIRMGFLEHAPAALAAVLRCALASLEAIEDMSDRLRELHIPTRVVVGGDDAGSVGPCRSLSRLIPGATLSVLEGAGHVVNLARVSDFNEELRQLVSRAMD